MTHILKPDPGEMKKWRRQADRIAAHLKAQKLDREEIKAGIAFDDSVITVTLTAKQIRESTTQQLADHIYQTVLTTAQTGGSA